MLPRLLSSRALLRISRAKRSPNVVARRTLIAAPKPGSGPLMERRSDRELPDVEASGMRWMRTVPIFIAILITSTLCIFNYQKSSSSVVSSTLYALRTSPKAREHLGDEIYFASQIPWIWGEMNQLHGRIDIAFEVKGTRGTATMRFKSRRPTRMGLFETSEWSLQMRGEEDKVDLLQGNDVFKALEMDPDEVKVVGRGTYAPNLSG